MRFVVDGGEVVVDSDNIEVDGVKIEVCGDEIRVTSGPYVIPRKNAVDWSQYTASGPTAKPGSVVLDDSGSSAPRVKREFMGGSYEIGS